jgi:PAS domain-containing protein
MLRSDLMRSGARSVDPPLGAETDDIAAQHAALRAIVDDLSVGIVLLDKDRRARFINRAFRRVWRITDALGRQPARIFRPTLPGPRPNRINGVASSAGRLCHQAIGPDLDR